MSDTASVSLLTLIRLLHHVLPADEGMRLRERMVTDRSLADRLRRVMEADHQSHPEHVGEPSPVLPPAEEIALFVEGEMTRRRRGSVRDTLRVFTVVAARSSGMLAIRAPAGR
jgi:hypothetical protein